jgi:hypothetical protein
MTKKTKTIIYRVDEQTKKDFVEIATNNRLTESELLGLIVSGAINGTKKTFYRTIKCKPKPKPTPN